MKDEDADHTPPPDIEAKSMTKRGEDTAKQSKEVKQHVGDPADVPPEEAREGTHRP